MALSVASWGCSEPPVAVDNPTPAITTISPATVDQGVAGQVIVVTGSDFVATSVVRLEGGDRPTQFVSRTEIRTTLPASDFAASGDRQLVVVNPPPGGGVSNPVTLAVRQPPFPVPTIASLNPPFVPAGSGATDVTITGTGFTAQSQAAVGINAKPTTYLSATQVRFTLTAAETAAPSTSQLVVTNPAPGGGASNAVTLEIRAPLPVLSSLSVSQTDAGQPGLQLGLTGSGFFAGSVAQFAGAARPTTVQSATSLSMALAEGDLRAAGGYQITVSNPGPGGGVSAALVFTVVNGVPELTLLPSQGATAGGSGFSLLVHGRRFVPGSVVRWNGANRPTTYLRGDRLLADIPASDVTAPTVASISVGTPAPGGGISVPSLPFTVRSLGSGTATSIVRTLTVGDLVYDPLSAKLYAAVAAGSPTQANSVVAIDPTTGTITGSTFVGSSPGRVALSGDGQFLYVGIDGANAVRRVTVPALVPGLQWSVGAGLVAGDIEVLPGLPHAVAVSRQNPGLSPPLAGVTVYDDGVARPNSSPGHTGGNRIAFLGAAEILYGFNNAHTGFGFYEIAIDASGADHASETGGLIGGFYTDILGMAGRVYGTDGRVVDAGRLTRLGAFPTGGSSLAVDPATGRAFMLVGGSITVFDLNTYQVIGTIPLPPIDFAHPALAVSRLVRWGVDGLAFFDLDELIIIRSPLIGP